MTLSSIDLFSGIGGLTLALAGVAHPLMYVDIDPASQHVLQHQVGKALPNAKIHDDIQTLTKVPKADMVIAGVPCIGWSPLGNRQALKQPQSALFYEMLRIVDESRASSVFLENVPNIVTISSNVIIKELAVKRGFELRWMFVSASQVGAPHERKRWFCLGYKPNSSLKQSSILASSYKPYAWTSSNQPPRTKRTDTMASFDARWGLLGNSVVPDAARFAFLSLFTGGAIGELRQHKTSLKFCSDLGAEVKGPSQGLLTHISAKTGKITYHEPIVPANDLKKDWKLVFDPLAVPLPLVKSKNQTTKRLTSPATASQWSTPRHGMTRPCNVLTKRSKGDHTTQIRFEKATTQRNAPINPQFGEWMMGYKVNHTL